MGTRVLPLRSDCFSNSCLRLESGLATQFDSTRRLRTRVNRDCGSTDSHNAKASEQRESKRPRYTSPAASRLGLTDVTGCRQAGHSGMARRPLVTGLRTKFTI